MDTTLKIIALTMIFIGVIWAHYGWYRTRQQRDDWKRRYENERECYYAKREDYNMLFDKHVELKKAVREACNK